MSIYFHHHIQPTIHWCLPVVTFPLCHLYPNHSSYPDLFSFPLAVRFTLLISIFKVLINSDEHNPPASIDSTAPIQVPHLCQDKLIKTPLSSCYPFMQVPSLATSWPSQTEHICLNFNTTHTAPQCLPNSCVLLLSQMCSSLQSKSPSIPPHLQFSSPITFWEWFLLSGRHTLFLLALIDPFNVARSSPKLFSFMQLLWILEKTKMFFPNTSIAFIVQYHSFALNYSLVGFSLIMYFTSTET